jgi:O-antigen/teichoic acid export membrane protein
LCEFPDGISIDAKVSAFVMSEVIPTGKLLIAEEPVSTGNRREPPLVEAMTRNSAVAMAGGLLSQGLKFLVVIYVARRLSVADFGLVSFAIAASGYTLTLSNFGLPVFGSRTVAKSGNISRGLLGEIACLRACLALAGTIVTVGVLWLAPAVGREELLLVGSFGLSNVAQAGLYDWVFQGLQRQEVSAILNIILQGGWLALTVAGMHLGMGVLAVPTALTGSAVIAAGICFYWLHRTGPIQRGGNGHRHVLRRSWEILKLGAPLGWGTLLVTVIIWSDTIVVRLLRGEQAVGLYAAGNRPALALAMLSSFYVQGAFPLLSQASHEGSSRLHQYFQRCYEDMAWVFVPGSLWAIFNAREVILLVFRNPEYLAAVPVFQVFQATFLLAAFSNLFGIGVVVATHRDHDYQKVLALTTITFLPLCAALTASAGNLGASVAALVAQALSLILFIRKSRNVVQPNHGLTLLMPALVGVSLGVIGRDMGLTFMWSVALLLLAYAVIFIVRLRATRQNGGFL